MNRELRAVPAGDGFSIIDQADGSVVDWISAPREAGVRRDGDTDSYVMITEHPEQWTEDMRWMVTIGQRVRQCTGLGEGRTGAITGQARGRKADRFFAANVAKAASIGRPLRDSDFECLIDSEGPLVRWDGETELDWYPGQAAGCIEPVEQSAAEGFADHLLAGGNPKDYPAPPSGE